MKKIVTILFFSIFLSGTGGLYYGYRLSVFIHYQQVRHSIRSCRPNTPSVQLLIPDTDLHLITWHKAGKEFEFQKILYDLVSSTRMNGCTLFKVLPDKREKRLATDYGRQKEKRKPLQQLLSKIFVFTCLLPDIQSGIIPEYHYIYHSYSHFPASCTSEIHPPPPKADLHS